MAEETKRWTKLPVNKSLFSRREPVEKPVESFFFGDDLVLVSDSKSALKDEISEYKSRLRRCGVNVL